MRRIRCTGRRSPRRAPDAWRPSTQSASSAPKAFTRGVAPGRVRSARTVLLAADRRRRERLVRARLPRLVLAVPLAGAAAALVHQADRDHLHAAVVALGHV